jgi:hypothetical protein
MYVKWLITRAGLLLSLGAIGAGIGANGSEFELSGKIGLDGRYFFADAQLPQQFASNQLSVFAEPEFYWGWNGDNDSLTFKPYYRYDSQDNERSHGDIRELSYIHAGDNWELRTGIRKEFWGVTEFQHLVDVINQTDGVEDVDGEDKLGQLMVNLSLVKEWGIVDLYLLPGFRERTFAGEDGRLRGPLVIDSDNIAYESSAAEHHLDLAMRWAHTLGDFDLGGYWFHGTNRKPTLIPTAIIVPGSNGEQLILRQFYQQMDQFGVDIQATIEDWLWKFESVYRDTRLENFWSAQAGFEYTYVGVMESAADVGLLIEYGWDSRGEADIDTVGTPFQNDLFVGSRIAFNDVQSSEILFGFGADLDHNAASFLLEASRRVGDDYKVSLDLRAFQSSEPADLIYSLRNDDHLQLTIARYF